MMTESAIQISKYAYPKLIRLVLRCRRQYIEKTRHSCSLSLSISDERQREILSLKTYRSHWYLSCNVFASVWHIKGDFIDRIFSSSAKEATVTTTELSGCVQVNAEANLIPMNLCMWNEEIIRFDEICKLGWREELSEKMILFRPMHTWDDVYRIDWHAILLRNQCRDSMFI